MLKQDIRKDFKEKRRQLEGKQRKELSAKILKIVTDEFSLEGKNVSIFLPIERQGEILTWDLLESKIAQFYLPVVKEDRNLVHILFENLEQIQTSNWGIPEPTFGKEINPIEFDIVLIPLLAVDRKGNRVGYGAGFYDNFLRQCHSECKFVGLNYFEPIEEISDVLETDIPIHYCVHPQGVEQFDFKEA